MGLDMSHGAWHGAYSAFMRWREKIAAVAGLPPLGLMEGFFEKGQYNDPFRAFAEETPNLAEAYYAALPIRWKALRPDPLHSLLNHSDCDGHLTPSQCSKIADRLEELLPLLPDEDTGGHIGNWREKTRIFIEGCRKAAAARQRLRFH